MTDQRTPENIAILAKKWQEGRITEAEKKEFELWYDVQENVFEMNAGESREQAEARIYSSILVKGNIIPLKMLSLWPRVAAISTAWKVAAAVTAITLGVWLYHVSNPNAVNPDQEVAAKQIFSGSNDIAPGRNTATLTLANGKTINLSDSKTGVVVGDDLKYNDGSAIADLSPSGRDGVAREGNNNSRSKVQTLTASTPRGGTYQVTLSDGTHVWLNADSKISFPSQFSGKQRKILLSGEAYFEVSKNKRMPFIVESKGQQIEVLGTHFNINAYADEASTKTTLLEGSVRVAFLSPFGRDGVAREGSKNNSNHLSLKGSLPEGERSIVLKPNEQSTVSSDNQIKITQVDPNEAIAWKNGAFSFNDENLGSLMKKIARWYDVEVIYKDDVKDFEFNGTISRFENISRVLAVLQATGKVHFKVERRKITVSK